MYSIFTFYRLIINYILTNIVTVITRVAMAIMAMRSDFAFVKFLVTNITEE